MANSLHVKKGDRVKVIAGHDKGKVGEIVKVFPKDEKVIVEGVNLIKKHTPQRPNAQGKTTGGIITTEAPIHVSNVAIVDPKTGKAARVGFEVRDGKKVRVLKGSGEVLNG